MNKLKHLCVLLLLVLGSTAVFAQSSGTFGVPNLLKYDKQRMHFGFMIGYNIADYMIESHADLTTSDSLMVINTKGYSGFNLGIVTNLRLGKYFDLRFIPTLSFIDRSVLYYRYNATLPQDYHQNTNPKFNVPGAVYLDLPLMVKLKSSRMMNNIRAYVLAGADYSVDLTSIAKKRVNTPEYVLALYPSDFMGQAGVGLDFYCTYFKFSTELKMSFGLRNLLVPNADVHATTVNSLKSKMIQISFTFE